MIPAIAQGRSHGLGHAAAAAQGERGVLGNLVITQQLRNGDVISVVSLQVPVCVDDGVDRLNGLRRGVQFVDQRNTRLLEGHRHPATANTKSPDAGNGPGEVFGAEGFVVKVQAQLFIQMIMKTQSEIPGSA